jgi:hypothetical protein
MTTQCEYRLQVSPPGHVPQFKKPVAQPFGGVPHMFVVHLSGVQPH